MKSNNDKELEKFIGKLMKETSAETPSPGFTSNLMTQVFLTDMEKVTVYKPLISKRAWFIIISSIVSFAAYFMFNLSARTDGWFFDSSALDSINDGFLKTVSAVKFSDATLYAVVLLTVLLFVQITFIKRYFNKRFEA